MLPEISINVEWENGLAEGFYSKTEANLFIENICMKIAPNKHYSVMSRTSYK